MTLRIAQDGRVRGLWTDHIDWPALGRVSVRRASHVEFDARRQLWIVRGAIPRGWRRVAQRLLGRPMGEILFRACRREEALAWERAWFAPGGQGWPRDSQLLGGGFAFVIARYRGLSHLHGVETNMPTSFFGLLDALLGWLRPPQNVRDHERQQAFGPRWKQHRPRRIHRYTRRRPRRSGT